MNKELYSNQVERLDEWAERLAEKVLKKEFAYIPEEVCFMACVYYIRNIISNKQSFLCKEYVMKIMDNKLEETNNILAKA